MVSRKIGVLSTSTEVSIAPDIPDPTDLQIKIITLSPGRSEKRLLSSEAAQTVKDLGMSLAKGTMVIIPFAPTFSYPSSSSPVFFFYSCSCKEEREEPLQPAAYKVICASMT